MASEDRGYCVFPKEHPQVNDGKDHFPINDIEHGRNALAQAGKYDKAPEWYDGSLKQLLATIRKKVSEKFPSIDVSESLHESLSSIGMRSLNESMRYEFQSQFIRGGNLILPEVIVIDNGVITWSKRKINLIGKDVKSMKIADAQGMNIDKGIIVTNFTIFGKGNNTIECHNFSIGDANKIKKLLNL